MTVWLALGVVLAVACVLLVARPFLREPAPADDRLDAPRPEEAERVALVEERDRALAALRELEFDHRTGKVTDEDYRASVGPLRHRVARTLRALAKGPAAVEIPEPPAEPYPPPTEPPGPVTVPEPLPEPSEPPGPVRVPEPGPEPGPPI